MLAVIAYFALVYPGSLPDHPLVRGWNDFILHVIAFAALSICAFVVQPVNVKTIALLTSFAVAFEIAQMFIPERESDLWDLAANMMGVAGAAVFIGIVRYVRATAADSSKSTAS